MHSPLLIIGLGNPGPKYELTRHNIGSWVLQDIATSIYANFSPHKRTNTLLSVGTIAGREVLLTNLRSMMNLSGQKAQALARFYKVEPSHIVVLHDDMEVDFGAINWRPAGGDRGHNGLKSISRALSSKDYIRLSLGIGRPPGSMPPQKFVLQRFNKREQEELPIIAARTLTQLEQAISSGLV
ncbi:MAG: aminoacyl-tRNA hydrolase [Corynebacterium sp.]|nr:aminoacyl-tRNA hydrolase [Corynebacterium sp.]